MGEPGERSRAHPLILGPHFPAQLWTCEKAAPSCSVLMSDQTSFAPTRTQPRRAKISPHDEGALDASKIISPRGIVRQSSARWRSLRSATRAESAAYVAAPGKQLTPYGAPLRKRIPAQSSCRPRGATPKSSFTSKRPHPVRGTAPKSATTSESTLPSLSGQRLALPCPRQFCRLDDLSRFTGCLRRDTRA